MASERKGSFTSSSDWQLSEVNWKSILLLFERKVVISFSEQLLGKHSAHVGVPTNWISGVIFESIRSMYC